VERVAREEKDFEKKRKLREEHEARDSKRIKKNKDKEGENLNIY
jgi:hypothetical protein